MLPEQRAEELALIEGAAAKPDPREDEFAILLTIFDLPEAYSECLVSALSVQKWRTASHPMLTLKRAVLSCAFARGAIGPQRVGVALGFSEEKMDLIHFRQNEAVATRDRNGDGVWRAGRGLNPDIEEREATRPLVERLQIDSSRPPVKWSDLAAALEHAGLDELEMAFVLGYLGRKRARAEFIADRATSATERKKLEAAVKRVHRKLPKIRGKLVGD